MYHSPGWISEPYQQKQNPAEGCCWTIKGSSNTIMNRSGVLDCWLLCMIYVCYLLNHISCDALASQIPLTKLYGVYPDIILLCTFHQPV